MFEVIEWFASIAAAWRTILHVGDWSGLAIGALIAGAALFYYVPAVRKLVVILAILVLVGWICLIHGDRTGRADLQAQWDAAKAAAEHAQAMRDAGIAFDLHKDYQPRLEALQRESDERKARADSYENKIVALLAKKPAAARADRCELGAAAVRMRGGR
jgi:hypothetical protein